MRKTAADPLRTGLVASLSPRVGCACIVIATSSRTAPFLAPASDGGQLRDTTALDDMQTFA